MYIKLQHSFITQDNIVIIKNDWDKCLPRVSSLRLIKCIKCVIITQIMTIKTMFDEEKD